MTRQETAAILSALIAAYPRSGIEANAETLALWHEMLGDLDAHEATLAVKGMIATLKYPPCIADVREAVRRQRGIASGELTAGEAWDRVMSAVGRYGYYRPEEAREALGESVWEIVRQVGGWSALCASDNVSVISAQFERRYNARKEQRDYQSQLPAGLAGEYAKLIGGIVLGIEDGRGN